MSLQVEKLEKNMAKLTIEVSAEDLEKAMQAAYQKAKGRISLPGFRKGKAPRKMIELIFESRDERSGTKCQRVVCSFAAFECFTVNKSFEVDCWI